MSTEMTGEGDRARIRPTKETAALLVAAVLCGSGCRRWDEGRTGPAETSPAPRQPPSSAIAPPAPTNRSDGGKVTPRVEPSPEAKALSTAFESVAKAIRPSVVRVDVEGMTSAGENEGGAPGDLPDFIKRFFEGEGQPGPAPRRLVRGTGSGVIVDVAGDVLTNGHVVREFQNVTVRLADERSFRARVVGTDPLTDVGIVRLEKPPSDLVAARLGDSNKLRIGQWALAVGSPLGMDQTVTIGIISGVGATGSHFRFESGERIRRYIQTDAKINPGNSGGPLVNLEGEVVGINTVINVGPGGSYGFAIPINQAWQVAGVLIKEGRIRYPYIGVSAMTLTPQLKGELARAGQNVPDKGAFVGGLTAAGPAADAGIKVGDVITAVSGRAVASADELVAAISDLRIGSSIGLDVLRDGRTSTVKVKVGEYPSGAPSQGAHAPVGIALQTLTPDIAESLGLDAGTKGAVITEVVPGSAAARAGLAAGDVIREIDKKPVVTAEDAVAAMRVGKETHLLRITNAAGTRFVALTPG
jgi:serine protease Do